MVPYEPPEYKSDAFNCPHCAAYSNQAWHKPYDHSSGSAGGVVHLDLAYCTRCHKYSLWREGRMIYPSSGSAPLPNPDLPDDIKVDYEETRSILSLSPRGAAALLRLAIQKLCKHLGEKGKDLNSDIAALVKRGLHPNVQKSLDIVRVIGNEAVHPGQIDLKDDTKTAEKLFHLVNLIAEAMISQPKHVDELYQSLPKTKKDQIAKRDKP